MQQIAALRRARCNPDSAEFKKVAQILERSISHKLQEYEQISFHVVAIEKVNNPALAQSFRDCQRLLRSRNRTSEELTVKVGFHGTRKDAINGICENGLLKIGHPLNPSKATDRGWFGSPTYTLPKHDHL